MLGRLCAVALVSATSLMWEVALTRLFSVVLQYHYVFLVVSLAVLGLGLGAVVVASTGFLTRSTGSGAALLTYLCSGLAVALPLTALAIVALGNVESVALYSLLAVIPFTLAGIVVSGLFTLWPTMAGLLYGADLLGAGVGAAAVVALLNLWGAVGVSVALGPLAALAGLALCWSGPPHPSTAPDEGVVVARRGPRRPLLVATAALILTVALGGANLATPLAQLNLSASTAAPPDKTMLHMLADPTQKAQVVWTRWDAFARTDVVRTADPATMLLFSDGGAGAAIYRFNGDIATMAGLRNDLPYLPYQVAASGGARPRKVLIIGPGGGYDVLLARLAGAAEITAVEINGAAVAAVRHFGAYDGHIYDLPGVTTVVGDGRNVVRRSHERYDLIVLRLVYSQAAEAASHALAESYIFTTEAFRDYIAHLTPGGYLAVTGHQALEALRAFTTGIAALQASGLSQTAAMKRVAALMTHNNDPQNRPSLMLLKGSAMNQRDVAVLRANSATLNLQPLYVPYLYSGGFDKLANGSQSLADFLAGGSDYAVGPTYDDKPFFFDFNLGLPDAVGAALVLALTLSAGIVVAGWLGRSRRRRGPASPARATPARLAGAKVARQVARRGPFWPLILYFALIGMAFMLAEVSLIQRFILLLGQPVLALVAVLGSLLIGAGLGSLASQRIVAGAPRRLAALAALIAVALALAVVALPAAVDALVPLDLSLRVLASIVLLLPLGFLLGMPFPSGLAMASPDAVAGDVAFLWAINAATSVLGSALAVTVALTSGFTMALWLAALTYLGVAAITLLRPRPQTAASGATAPENRRVGAAEALPR